MTAKMLRTKLQKLAEKETAEVLQRFFKTGPGQYGEGDIFLGISVLVLRKLSKEHDRLPLNETIQLLKSPIHEERLLALLLLVRIFSKGDTAIRKKIHNLYPKHIGYINN